MTDSAATAQGVAVYRRLLGYSLRYWPLILIAVIGMVLTGAMQTGFAALMKPMLDGSFVERDPSITRWVGFLILAVFVISGISSLASNYFMSRVAFTVVKELRNELFGKYLRLPTRKYDVSSSGQLLSRITYNTEQVAAAATSSLTTLVRDSATVLGLLAWMFFLHWQLTLGFLIIAPFVTLVVVYITRRFRGISKRIQGSMGDVTHVAEEMIDAHRVVRIFGGQEYEKARFERANERNRHLNLKMVVTKSAAAPVIQMFLALVLVVIIFYASQPAFSDTITVGAFMSFMVAMMMLMSPVKRLTEVNAILQKGIAAGEDIFTLIDEEEERDSGMTALESAQGRLEFRHVWYRYGDELPWVLKNIDFIVEPGQTVALVGPSGSGKSTLFNLLPRLYEVTKGDILLDGHPITSLTMKSLRQLIAYVGQEVTLFNDTVRNNIAYGQLNNTSASEIEQASRSAHAWDFIQNLPKGLDTEVGENGIMLSGGQRQRLSIARALLKNAPILILDEATASLDTEAERHIQAALENVSANRTTLVIAHRLSTVERADCILVMKEGEIIEKGTHAELLQLGGLYAQLYRMQFDEKD